MAQTQIQCPRCDSNLNSENRYSFRCIPCGIIIEIHPATGDTNIRRIYPRCGMCGEERDGNGDCKSKHRWESWPEPERKGW